MTGTVETLWRIHDDPGGDPAPLLAQITDLSETLEAGQTCQLELNQVENELA